MHSVDQEKIIAYMDQIDGIFGEILPDLERINGITQIINVLCYLNFLLFTE